MARTPSGPMPAVDCKIKTSQRPDGIVITTMEGVANGALAEEVRYQLIPHLFKSHPVDWIPDASKISKIDLTTLLGPAKNVLKAFKDGNGRFVVAVVTDQTVLMAARTISFGAKMIGGSAIDDIAGTIPEAVQKLEQLRRNQESA